MQGLERIGNLIPEIRGLNVYRVLEVSRLRVERDRRAKFAAQGVLLLESAVKNDGLIEFGRKGDIRPLKPRNLCTRLLEQSFEGQRFSPQRTVYF